MRVETGGRLRRRWWAANLSGREVLAPRVAYGLDEVEGVEIEEFETGKTTAVVGGILGGWFLFLLIAGG